MSLEVPKGQEQPVVGKASVDAAKLTAAKQKDAVMALLAAHPDVREKLGL